MRTATQRLLIPAAALLAALAGPALAVDGLALTLGHGDSDTRLYRLGARQDFGHYATDGAWQFTGAWLGEVGYWHSTRSHVQHDQLWEIALTPVLRLEPTHPDTVAPYVEVGLGAHGLSHTEIGNQQLATAWQFGSHLGFGLNLGSRVALGYRFQHLSNASIKQPNDGINFHQLVLDWRY